MFQMIQVQGKDAQEFLHRVTAGIIKAGAIGSVKRGLLLTGQGKIMAQFDLLRMSADQFLLASPVSCHAKLYEALDSLLFSESLTLTKFDQVYGISTGASTDPSHAEGVFPNIKWPLAVPGFWGTPQISVPDEWDFHRIGAFYPWPKLDWTENTMALEAGMLTWIDRNKGCYPGQEVVEKSINLGHPPRVLVAMEGKARVQTGEVDLNDSKVRITSIASRNGIYRAMVSMPWKLKDSVLPGFEKIAGDF